MFDKTEVTRGKFLELKASANACFCASNAKKLTGVLTICVPGIGEIYPVRVQVLGLGAILSVL